MPTLQEWLEDPSAVRGIFVIATATVDDVDTLVYLSSTGYMTSDSLTSFDPVIKTGVRFTESLSIEGGTSLSYGDIEINNYNGDLDHWLDSDHYIWKNRSVKIYVGDPRWVATSISNFTDTVFFKVFDGVIADIDSRNRENLNLKLRDKMEKLNTAISENTLGEYGVWTSGVFPNKHQLKPLIFGEVHNITPIVTNPAEQEYMVNDGITEQIIEIRDNGVPIYTSNTTGVVGAVPILDYATLNLTTLSPDLEVLPAVGSFRLDKPSAGTITVSVQGVKNSVNLANGSFVSNTYSNNIANLIALIVTQYGTEKLSGSTELDHTNFGNFAGNTQPVGIFIRDRENVINVCQSLAESIGAQLYMTRTGILQILRLGDYTLDASVTITDNEIIHHSLEISNKTNVVAGISSNTVKNWTVQEGIITGIPDLHKAMFAEEHTPSTTEDNAVATKYKISTKSVPTESYLLKKVDADAETLRLLNYFKVPRTVYKFTGTSKLMSLKLGQQVTLIHNRFGLYNSGTGKVGQVISLSADWLNAKIEVEVII